MIYKPKGIEYRATYDPDMDKMVKALKAVMEYEPALSSELVEVKPIEILDEAKRKVG